MKKIALAFCTFACLSIAASAQTIQKTRSKNREKQGVIMTDSPNTIAPAPPADATRNNNTIQRTDPANPTRSNPDNNNTNLQKQNSLDNQPLNNNNNNMNTQQPMDMSRPGSDLNNISTPITPPPPSK